MTTNDDTTAGGCDVACSLPSAQQTARFGELMNGLLARVTHAVELSNGYAFEFGDSAQTRTDIEAFIKFEQQCCEFMTYTVTEKRVGVVTLALTGPEGTKQFLAKWIGTARIARIAKPGLPGDQRFGLPGDQWDDSSRNEAPQAGTMKRAAALGATAAALGALCCATPALAAITAALGIAHATGTVAAAIDVTTPLLLAGSVALFVVGRRHQSRAAGNGKISKDCGC